VVARPGSAAADAVPGRSAGRSGGLAHVRGVDLTPHLADFVVADVGGNRPRRVPGHAPGARGRGRGRDLRRGTLTVAAAAGLGLSELANVVIGAQGAFDPRTGLLSSAPCLRSFSFDRDQVDVVLDGDLETELSLSRAARRSPASRGMCAPRRAGRCAVERACAPITTFASSDSPRPAAAATCESASPKVPTTSAPSCTGSVTCTRRGRCRRRRHHEVGEVRGQVDGRDVREAAPDRPRCARGPRPPLRARPCRPRRPVPAG